MRRAPAEVRTLDPDPVYRSVLVTQVINKVLWRGKKGAARRIVYGALEIVDKRTGGDPLQTLKAAIDNIRPAVEVRSRRVGGSSYQVPMEVSRKRQETLAIRTILKVARSKKGKPMAHRLADEFAAAYRKEGASITWRENTHKMAEANKLFAHYAW